MENENNAGAAQAVAEDLTPKRAAFIKWAAGRGLDVTEVRDAWGKRRFLALIIDGMWEGWFNAPVEAVVYPPDGTTSPFTVVNLGSGSVKIGDCVHDGRLPGLWFGKDGLGMGVEEVLNRQAADGETLAVVTFTNVEGLDVLLEVVQRIRRIKFPGAPINATANSLEQSPRLAGYIDRKDLVRLSNCRATIWPGTNEIDAVPVYLGAPPADVCADMRALCSSCGGTGDVHRADGEWMGECTCALAVAQRDAERNKQLFIAACGDLGLVSEALGLDPDDGGATPIIDAIKALQAGVPAGWKAVPIEPTEDMVIDGFESRPDRMFDGPDYPEEYDTMSGCQQAAFRAKRCWAAMLEAAPAAGTPP